MNFSVSNISKQLKEFYKKLTKKTKIILFVSLGIIVAAAIILSIVLNNSKYTVLYSGLSSSEGAKILSLLEDQAVDVKVENDGTILVPEEKEATLKMQLASEGYPQSTLNYDVFMDKSDLFTTDYEKKKLLIFQLQNRLQDSIKTIRGVENAIVNLSIPEDNSYVLKDEKIDIKASVKLQVSSNSELSSKQIKGIERLVANSVPGLEPENVAVIGNEGEQLNKNSAESELDGTYLKIDTINLINKVFEERIKDFLKPILGPDGFSIACNVSVDFDKVSTKETIYTPVIGDNGIISWVERSGSKSEEKDGADGVPGTGSNTDVPTYEETSTETSDSTYSNEHFNAQYLVNQLVKEIQDNGGNITDMTVAVVINSKDLSEDNIAKYKELVAYSAGISEEKVAVTNAEFFKHPDSDDKDTDTENNDVLLGLGKTELFIIAGSLLLLIIVFVILIILLRKKKKKKLEKLLEQAKNSAEKAKTEDMPGEIVLNETREQALKRQIKEFSSSNPEAVAQLLRVWIKGDDTN